MKTRVQISIPYLLPKCLKTPALWGHTYLCSPFKGVPPAPLPLPGTVPHLSFLPTGLKILVCRLSSVLSVRPGSRQSSGGYSLVNGLFPAFSTRGKGALEPLLSAPAGANRRETPTSNLTESSVSCSIVALDPFFF